MHGHRSDSNVVTMPSEISIAIEEPLSSNGSQEQSIQRLDNHEEDDRGAIKFRDWGFKLDRLFEVAYRFYKRNESKAFHPSFDERNHMNALILQARYGNFDHGKSTDVGVLDIVGRRRQYEWSLLKGMSKTEAMSKFICLMDELCPFFKAHAEAVKISSGINTTSNTIGKDDSKQTVQQATNNNQIIQESNEQLQAIYASLCRQTHNQFKVYAEKQFPDDISQQRTMISTLQDQYYQNYISQMHPELRATVSASSRESEMSSDVISSSVITPGSSESCTIPDGNLNSETPSLNSNHIHDSKFKDEPHDVQADISSEELNAVDEPDILVGLSQQPSNQSISNETHVQSDTEQTNYVEHVKLYQNTKPSIGTFESFPEPKPINRAQQRGRGPQSIVPKLMNPNIPRGRDTLEGGQGQAKRETNGQSQPTNEQKNVSKEEAANSDEPRDPDPSREPIASDVHLDDVSCECSQANDNEPSPTPKELWNYSPPPMPLVPERPLEAATIWSKPGVNEFKLSLANDKQGGLYEVKQNTLVCIQVPTYKDGKYVYFEFATDDYDIGFGLDFVYELNLAQPPAINIYEESDDEDDDGEDDATVEGLSERDIESGHEQNEVDKIALAKQQSRAAKMRKLANTVQIIPTYRRNCHEEIFVGRHQYPGTGYYVLKFDNTYSVLRSKTLHFRICYFV